MKKSGMVVLTNYLIVVLLLTSCWFSSADQTEIRLENTAITEDQETISTDSSSLSTAEGSNGRIAFVSYRDGNPEIYVMNADGSGQVRLTHNDFEDHAPSWSPDGKQIVFVSNREGSNDLYIMNADGSQQSRLVETPTYRNRPKWSPDGQQIAFEAGEGIYVLNIGTGEITQATGEGYYAERPSWTSDGQHILFVSGKDHTNVYLNELYLVSLIDGNVRLLSNLEDRITFVSPVLSPDDQMVLFRYGDDPDAGIFHISLKQSSPLVLYVAGERPRSEIMAGGQLFPNWSPDGQQVVFSSGEIGAVNIYTLELQSGALKQLTDSPANDISPDWWMP